jgi:Fe-S cluster assembly scaffold protein SufB
MKPEILNITGGAQTIDLHIKANEEKLYVEDWSAAKTDTDLKVIIKAEKDARVKYVAFQNAEGISITEFRQVFVTSGARVHLIVVHLGAGTVSSTIHQNGTEAHATLDTDLVSRTKGNQKHVFEVINEFHERNGRGEIHARGVAMDQSELALHGVIKISKNGGGTETFLHQNALLLSKEAKVKATPALNIDTNDVKASHGASVSNLSDEALFYAESRGIPADEARHMMATGFLSERLSALDGLPELKEAIMNAL